MGKYIVDTNVAHLAAKKDFADESEQNCGKKSFVFLHKLMTSTTDSIVLDQAYEILNEYKRKINLNGQPNIATEFVKWALEQYNKKYDAVVIDTMKIGENEYETYPSIEELSNFDPSDRKFIAVANAHPQKPPIVEASDSKWWGIKEYLSEIGITIQFIDEEYIKKIYERKMVK